MAYTPKQRREYDRLYYANNKEKEIAKVRRWQKRNPEKVKTIDKVRRERNPEARREAVRQCNAKYRAIVIQAKSKSCVDCGRSYPPYVMDFDHREDKKFNIASWRSHSLQEILQEIAKCDVVCANCHRERTHGAKS